MKALALEYVFVVVIVIVVIFVSVSIILGIIKPELIPGIEQTSDVRYACSRYNNSRIDFENFKTVLYGFLTDQCNNFSAELKQDITFEDLQRVVDEIKKTRVIKLSYCHFLETNVGAVYTCCSDRFEADKNINITRREIKNSDVLICGEE